MKSSETNTPQKNIFMSQMAEYDARIILVTILKTQIISQIITASAKVIQGITATGMAKNIIGDDTANLISKTSGILASTLKQFNNILGLCKSLKETSINIQKEELEQNKEGQQIKIGILKDLLNKKQRQEDSSLQLISQ